MFGVVGRDHFAVARLKVILSLSAVAAMVLVFLVVTLGFAVPMAIALG